MASTLYKYDLRFVCSKLGEGATSETGKYLFKAANGWWWCTQYFVIDSCGYMPRDNICMYMTHVCCNVCCSDCVGYVEMFVAYRPLLNIVVFFILGVLKYVGVFV